MLLSTRTFLRHYRWTFSLVLLTFLSISAFSTWTLSSLVTAVLRGEYSQEQRSQVIAGSVLLSLFGVYIIGAYVTWLARYHYFYKLLELLRNRMKNTDLVYLMLDRGPIELVHEGGFYYLSTTNTSQSKPLLLVTIGNGYFNEAKQLPGDSSAVVSMRYLGPMRGLSNAKTFRDWYRELRMASQMRVDRHS